MSQCDKLDFLLVESIKAGNRMFSDIFQGDVMKEAMKLRQADWQIKGRNAKPASRFVDSRLQALRKRSVIEHSRGWGWRYKGGEK